MGQSLLLSNCLSGIARSQSCSQVRKHKRSWPDRIRECVEADANLGIATNGGAALIALRGPKVSLSGSGKDSSSSTRLVQQNEGMLSPVWHEASPNKAADRRIACCPKDAYRAMRRNVEETTGCCKIIRETDKVDASVVMKRGPHLCLCPARPTSQTPKHCQPRSKRHARCAWHHECTRVMCSLRGNRTVRTDEFEHVMICCFPHAWWFALSLLSVIKSCGKLCTEDDADEFGEFSEIGEFSCA